MPITTAKFCNFMAFEGEHELNFIDGINVIMGENGTGKTTVLKAIYAIMQNAEIPARLELEIEKYFASGDFSISKLFHSEKLGFFEIHSSDGFFSVGEDKNGIRFEKNLGFRKLETVFIPTTEMISHSKGFLALNRKYKLPFDETQVDIISNASLPETREISATMAKILEKISTVIDGTVIQEDDVFYVVKHDGRKIEFSLEAEGLRKFALIWKLIRNGLLESGSVLLWDEPEANLNPELYELAAEILLELQKNGVQVFVATHSYNFAKYLEIRRTEPEQVQFHNLYRASDGRICNESAFRMEDLTQNHIMMADNKLLDEIFDM